MNRSRSASDAHTDIDPLRDAAGRAHSHMPTAPGIAYHPIRMRSPLAAMPGSMRRCCAENSVTLTTTGASCGSTGPGIQGVSKGQKEAALAIGLTQGQSLRLVVIPQAMRIIIPPLTSQFLNLTKNSSLAVAIGYPDLVSVWSGTVLNQTGQAVEVILVTMCVFLAISLVTSAFMNWFNRRMALVER